MLEITVKWSKTADVDVRRRLQRPMAVGKATARHIKARVLRGKTATRPEPFSTDPKAGPKKRTRYYLSPAYAKELGLGGETRWKSSAEMHTTKGIKPGTANATGGMWKGLQVRNYGNKGGVIEFARSSLGASSTRTAITKKSHGEYEVTVAKGGRLKAKQVRELARDEGGNVKYRRKPKLVRNRTKAAAVFRNSRVGLLQPTPAESQAQFAAVAHAAEAVVVHAFGSKLVHSGTDNGDRRLFDAIIKEMT